MRTDGNKLGSKKRKLVSCTGGVNETVVNRLNEIALNDNPAPKKTKTSASSILDAARRAFSIVSESIMSVIRPTAGWLMPSSSVTTSTNTTTTATTTSALLSIPRQDDLMRSTDMAPQVIRESNSPFYTDSSLLRGVNCKLKVSGGLDTGSSVATFRNSVRSMSVVSEQCLHLVTFIS